MKTFTKWFIINAVVLTLAFFAGTHGLFSLILQNDLSYISPLSMILFIGFSIFCGKMSADSDKIITKTQKESLIKKMGIGWFAAEHFLTLGLLGTCVGFCLIINSTLIENKDVNSIIGELKTGAGTALYTTLVGIVCSILLQIQLFTIQYSFRNVK